MIHSPNSLTHIKQPRGSSLCGQTCLAMYLGISLGESIFWFNGKRSGTNTRILCYVLRNQGVDIALNSRLRVIYRGVKVPRTGILRIKWKIPDRKVNHGHWVLKVGDMIHDPEQEWPVEYEDYVARILPPLYGKITSFLKLPDIN